MSYDRYGRSSTTLLGLDQWTTAISNVLSAPADVVVISDSIGVLGDATTDLPWPWIAGKHLSSFENRAESIGMAFAKTTDAVPVLATTGGVASTSGIGGYASNLAVGDTLEHTATCDGVTVIWSRQVGGGGIEVRDGGSGGTLKTTISTAGTAGASFYTTVDFTTYASRAVNLKCVTAAARVEAVYFHAGDQTTGVRFWPVGRVGSTTADYVSTTAYGLDFISNLLPDLVIIATGYNDTNSTTYTSSLNSLIDAIRTRSSGSSIAILSPWGGNNVSDSRAKALAAASVASIKRCALLDLYAAVGNISNNVDPWDQSSDGAHPRPGASTMIADIVLQGISNNGDYIDVTTLERGPRDLVGTLLHNRTTKGSTSISSVLGYSVFQMFGNSTDTQAQFALYNSTVAGLFGLPGFTLALGPGGSTGADTFLSRSGVNALQMSGSLSTVGTAGAGFIQLLEQSPSPSNGPVNTARLYTKDNGGGKTQLCVKFNTGVDIVLATEV